MYDVDVQIMVQSEFNIVKAYGKEDLYKSSLIPLTNNDISSFTVNIIHVIYGKQYNYVVL